MIALLKRYWRVCACFISGLVVAVLFSFATPDQQSATTLVQLPTQVAIKPVALGNPDSFYSHQEPNFYQY